MTIKRKKSLSVDKNKSVGSGGCRLRIITNLLTTNGHICRHWLFAMTFIVTSLLVTFCTAVVQPPPVDTQLITSPPKLKAESARIVWFHIPNGGTSQKFELKCDATGDPERYEWLKNGQSYTVDKKRVVWKREGQSGTIIFLQPNPSDQGFYQCRVINIFGIALSNIFQVKLGALEHFPTRPIREITVAQGDVLTLPCKAPYGVPKPTVFWLFRNTKQTFVIETIDRQHITVDGEGNLQFSYVEMHDGRENLLYQCAATNPVLYGEYRAGDEIRLIVKDGPLKPTPPKGLWFTPSDVRVTAGEALKLMCIFSGYPAPQVKWSKKGGDLPVERLNHENFGRTLVIKPVLKSDEGTYVCGVDNSSQHHAMHVQVTSAPQWIDGPPDDFDLPEEADVELKCPATGDPPPVVRWYKNGKPIEDGIDSNERRAIVGNGETLQIFKVQHNIDRAVYQCNASNPLGYVFANAYVNVKAHAPEFDTPMNQTIKVTAGSFVNLDCSVKAAPLPRVKWMNNENHEITPIGGKYEILPNYTLRIWNARPSDAHSYFCDVVNKFGINKARRNLEVYEPSVWVHKLTPSEKTLEAGDEYEMVCIAKSDERLSMNYIWMKHDVPIDFSAETSLQRTPAPNRIKLVNVRGRSSGKYKCVAKTDVDEISTEMKLTVKDVPDSPIITNIQCRESQALISWTPAFNNSDRIQEYIVEFSTDFHPNDWKIGVTVPNRDQNAFEAAVNLSPWVVYSFKVAAANSYGIGNAGYMPSVKCSTPPSYPYDNPSNVSAAGNRKDNLIVYWKPLEKELWNAPGLYYLVRCRLAEALSHEDNISWIERRIEDPLLDHTEFRSMPNYDILAYRKFYVQVRSYNSVGPSLEEPTTVEGYSGEDEPLFAPKNFKVVEVNATWVKFSWDPVNERTVNGRLRGYKIKAWAVSKRRKRSTFTTETEQIEVEVPPFQHSGVVTGLNPLQEYAAYAVVFNTNFESRPTDTIRFTTKEGPPGQVDNLEIIPYGAKTILTTWSPPTELKDNGPNYKSEAVVYIGTHHHLTDSLTPDTSYTVFVWAETGGGHGPKLSRTVRTYAKEEKPGKPDFTAQILDSKTVVINWIPSKTGMPGTSFHVNYSKIDSDVWQKSQTVTLPEHKITIANLTAESEYKFVLYAEDQGKATMSDVKIIRIENRTMSEQTRRNVQAEGKKVENNLIGAAWFIVVICALAVAVLTMLVVCVCRVNKGGKYPVKKKELERGHNLDKDEEQSFMEYQYGSGSSDLTNS